MKFLTRARKLKFDAEKEKRFRESFAENNIASARLILGQLLLVFFLAGYFDVLLLGELATFMVFLRYSTFTPLLLFLFLFSFTRWFKNSMQLVFSLTVVLVSCYVALFTYLNEDITAMLYFAGIIVVVFVSFVYVPIFFNYAFVMSVFVFAISVSGLLYNETLSVDLMEACSFILLASIVMALAACYGNERSARLNFHYSEMLNLEKDSLAKKNVHLRNLATLDGLTGIPNRRAFDEQLNEEWQRAERSQIPLAILLIDVDHFKLYNDFYGHQTGDDCLQKIASALDASIGRAGDFVARYGGEEFVMILPNADINQAKEFGKKVLRNIEKLQIPHEKSPVAPVVTLSLGIASAVPGVEDYTEAEFLIRDADRALYQAKSDGRNRVIGFAALH